MIVGTTKGSANIPEEAIKLTKEEALAHQKNLVESWPSVEEVQVSPPVDKEFQSRFFLRFGRHIAAASTFLSSAAIINAFHPILKFGTGTITSVIPAISVPTALVFYKVDNVLTNEILTMKMNCPLCHHIKFLALQVYASIGFPGLIGLLSTNAGHNVPFQKTDTREYWKKTFQIAKTKTGIFNGILLGQVILTFAVPYMQNLEITNLMKKLSENPKEEAPEEIL